ncbi:hypothetical protein SAMN05444274_103179 [Mariniphaga anaerophila]|uniref:Uncharacterized protein n=1 Tax=Mariniphaga anaerophila TaxID=1484053 RepID=A0A1M4XZM9_9BACT|nr:hypothetical protein SAMN05444274_103179 [Mariniphaga anaerophila]
MNEDICQSFPVIDIMIGIKKALTQIKAAFCLELSS